MANITLDTTVLQRTDLLANWISVDPIPLDSEIILVNIPSGSTDKGIVGPALGMKIGDGVTKFSLLNYFESNAIDVSDWAKAATKPAYTAAEVGAAPTSHGTHVIYSTIAGSAPGTAAIGTSVNVARADHVHPKQTTVDGNSGTATKLQTARNIGNASFDGSANITLADIGAAPTSHGSHVTFTENAPKADGIAAVGVSESVSREDHVHPIQTTISGNAATATKLAAARTISISGGATGTATPFDGSANASINVTALDATKLVGLVNIDNIPKGALERCVVVADDTARFALTIDQIQQGDTVKVESTGYLFYVKDETQLNVEAGYMTYSSGTASSVDWSGIIGKPSAFTPTSHTHGNITNGGNIGTVAGKVITTTTNGLLQAETENDAFNKTFENTVSNLKAPGTAAVGTSANIPRADHVHPAQTAISGNAGTSTKLETARSIGNASFDGSANITLAAMGAAAASHGTHVTYSTVVGSAPGTAAIGSSANVARADHVHPVQTTITGNAATASKLVNKTLKELFNPVTTSGSTIVLQADLFVASAVHAAHGYGYLYKYPCTGITANMILEVFFNIASIDIASAAEIVIDSELNYINFYAKAIPEDILIIDYINAPVSY